MSSEVAPRWILLRSPGTQLGPCLRGSQPQLMVRSFLVSPGNGYLSSLTASLITLPPRNVLRLMLSFANSICGFLCLVHPLFFPHLEQIRVTSDDSALSHLSVHISTLASIHLSTHPSISHLSACFPSETACLKFSQMMPKQSCFTLY